MKRLFRIESNKAIYNYWFAAALIIATTLAVASAVIRINTNATTLQWIENQWVGLSSLGAYAGWIVVDWNVACQNFFLLLPLLAIVPYSTSLRTELITGVFSQMVVRSRRANYLLAKSVASFEAGFLIAIIPLLLNFGLLACFCPAYVPEALDNINFGIIPTTLFADLFYGAPLAYVAVNALADGLLCGAWAFLVLAVSSLVDNRVILLAGSYLLLMAIRYLNAVVFQAFGIQGFCFNLFGLLVGNGTGEPRTLASLTGVLLSMLSVGALLLWARKDADVL